MLFSFADQPRYSCAAINFVNMWQPASLPYVRKDLDLYVPHRLPTAEECRAVSVALQKEVVSQVLFFEYHVVKYGGAVYPNEGHALLYLEDCIPEIPAPRLLAMFQDAKQTFIIMERIPGKTLEEAWGGMSDAEKDEIMLELKTSFDKMRQHQCPWQNFFGGADGGPIPFFLFWTPEMKSEISGPFQSEDAFNMGLVRKYEEEQAYNNCVSFRSAFYARHLGKVLHSHRPAFTHSDVQRKNIIVIDRDAELASQHLKTSRIAIVDWENGGWYPEYWEYFSSIIGIRWDDDWLTRVDDFLTPFPAEFGLMKMVYHDLFF